MKDVILELEQDLNKIHDLVKEIESDKFKKINMKRHKRSGGIIYFVHFFVSALFMFFSWFIYAYFIKNEIFSDELLNSFFGFFLFIFAFYPSVFIFLKKDDYLKKVAINLCLLLLNAMVCLIFFIKFSLFLEYKSFYLYFMTVSAASTFYRFFDFIDSFGPKINTDELKKEYEGLLLELDHIDSKINSMKNIILTDNNHILDLIERSENSNELKKIKKSYVFLRKDLDKIQGENKEVNPYESLKKSIKKERKIKIIIV